MNNLWKISSLHHGQHNSKNGLTTKREAILKAKEMSGRKIKRLAKL